MRRTRLPDFASASAACMTIGAVKGHVSLPRGVDVTAVATVALVAVTSVYVLATIKIANETADSARAGRDTVRASLLSLASQWETRLDLTVSGIVRDADGMIARVEFSVLNVGPSMALRASVGCNAPHVVLEADVPPRLGPMAEVACVARVDPGARGRSMVGQGVWSMSIAAEDVVGVTKTEIYTVTVHEDNRAEVTRMSSSRKFDPNDSLQRAIENLKAQVDSK